MNDKKEIEEMAKLMHPDLCFHASLPECQETSCDICQATRLYNAGYRKQRWKAVFSMSGHGLDKKDCADIAEQLYHESYRKQSDLTPCDVCRFNPPSSTDGKPCLVCPAQAKGGAE